MLKALVRSRSRVVALVVAMALIATLVAACGDDDSATTSGKINVVAAENFWGSIATQLGGDKVNVNAIITSPDTDPHDYEATPGDGRAVADAKYVILNGVGYDPWVDQLLAASPASGRTTLKVQDVLRLTEGDNPHRWYSPTDVSKVIDQITADYKKIDPADAAFFDKQKSDIESTAFKQYNDLVALIKQKYAGTPIGATESIVSPLADALGLKMMTPAAFLIAISEGSDPTAQDKATFDSQIADKQIAVLVFNTQNATPDVQRLVDAANARGIPVVAVTETLDPAGSTFEDWQSKQLQALADALGKATGR